MFLRVASDGVADAYMFWWNHERDWFDDRLDDSWNPHMPLERLWSAFPLFEAVNALAIVQRTPAAHAAVHDFATGARGYWNRDRGGYAYYPGARGLKQTYFDDNGWWAIAFIDAFRASGDRSYLGDADRAFRFIVIEGWDNLRGGGVWWDTSRHHKTSEPLAAAIYAGAALYRHTRDPFYLREALKLLAWADRHSWNAERGLYGRNVMDNTVMNYVQGMMIGAHLELCRVTRDESYCWKARELAEASLVAFPSDWTPVTDSIYLRFLLDLYRFDSDPRWYTVAYANANRALANARGSYGLFVRRWDGSPGAGSLRDHAGTLSLFAWLAAAPLPSTRSGPNGVPR
jgi:uncharacterized protein YyaL (SSP411 family)